MDVLQREAIYLWYYFDVQFRQIFGYWVLGMVLGSAVSVFLKDRIHKTVRALGQRKLGIWGIALSSFWALPLRCACTERFPLQPPFRAAVCGTTGWRPL